MKHRYNPKSADASEPRKVRHQVFCVQANQQKLKFASEEKALLSLDFLREEDFPKGKMPIRAYYCASCAGWHVTSAEKR